MTINNLSAFISSVWSWPFACSDMDAAVNQSYRDLLIETKGPYTVVPDSQQYWFSQRTERGDSALIVRGDPGRIHPDDVHKLHTACDLIDSLRREPPHVQSIELWGTGRAVPATMDDLTRLVGEFRDFARRAVRPPIAIDRWRPSFLVTK